MTAFKRTFPPAHPMRSGQKDEARGSLGRAMQPWLVLAQQQQP